MYDVGFEPNSESVFITAGADASIRMFDSRNLTECSVFFDDPQGTPVTQIAWNKDGNLIAASLLDANTVIILDKRYASVNHVHINSSDKDTKATTKKTTPATPATPVTTATTVTQATPATPATQATPVTTATPTTPATPATQEDQSYL